MNNLVIPQSSAMPRYELDQILPKPIFDHTSFPLLKYRNYPVFSWSWFWRRALLVSAVTILLSMLLALITNVTEPKDNAILQGIHIFLAYAGAAILPTFLATLVRQKFDRRRGLFAVLALSVALGGFAQFRINMWMNDTFPKPTMLENNSVMKQKVDADKKAIEESFSAKLANFALTSAFYLAVGGIFAVIRYPSELRQWKAGLQNFALRNAENLRRESDQKLSVLQAQIEPHFLFNTLASIRSLVRREPARAEDSIDALVDYLRLTLPKFRDGVNAHQSTLKEQFDLCESYLQLMKVRMGDRLTYDLNLPVAAHNYPFPSLMLITLVENAIKHGLEPKVAAGMVTIDAEIDNKILVVSVADNGVGLGNAISQEAKVGAGLGLSNIRAQLLERYKGLASLNITGQPNAGFTAKITIPLN